MTSIHRAFRHQLESLYQLLGQLNNEAYVYASNWLSDATIGQHSRHVIELAQCLLDGYKSGVVNYDNRKRNKEIETNKHIAMEAITLFLTTYNKPDKPLLIGGHFDNDDIAEVASTYNRELVYNIEHAVHHMALIKVGLKELNMNLVDETFGVAYATVQYRKLCAQ